MSDTTKQQKIREALENKLSRYFGVAADDASKDQVYKAVILTAKDMLTSGSRWRNCPSLQNMPENIWTGPT